MFYHKCTKHYVRITRLFAINKLWIVTLQFFKCLIIKNQGKFSSLATLKMFYWRIGLKESNGTKIILIIVATWTAFPIKSRLFSKNFMLILFRMIWMIQKWNFFRCRVIRWPARPPLKFTPPPWTPLEVGPLAIPVK